MNPEVKIKIARQKIDLARPGAIEAVTALQLRLNVARDKGEPLDQLAKDFESVAAQYPFQLAGPPPMSKTQHAMIRAKLADRHDKAVLSVRAGSDITYDSPPRISTGCLSLDYLMSGGVPRGYIGQFKGAYSNGKTFTAMQTAANAIRSGGRVLWLAAERFDKPWARKSGIPIPYSESELAGMDPEQRDSALEFNEAHPEGENFEVLTGRNGNELLQYVVDCVAENVYDLIVVDSIAVLRRAKMLDEKEVGFDQMGGESKMFNDFCSRIESAFNSVEARQGVVLQAAYRCLTCGEIVSKQKDHKKCADGGKPKFVNESITGDAVRTAVIVINQIREQGLGSMYYVRPDAGGGHGLRHAKGYDIEFLRGEVLTYDYNGVEIAYGKRVVAEATKSKIGPAHREAVFEIWFETIPGLSEAGGFNPVVDLIGCKWKDKERLLGLGERAGVITIENNTIYKIGDLSFKGLPAFTAAMQDPNNAHILEAARTEIHQWMLKQV